MYLPLNHDLSSRDAVPVVSQFHKLLLSPYFIKEFISREFYHPNNCAKSIMMQIYASSTEHGALKDDS